MTRTITWVVGSALLGVGLLSSEGCLIKIDNGETGGGSSTTGSNTTGSNTTGSNTTSGYTTVTSTTGSGTLPSSCDTRTDDDSCTACEKKSCCAELSACSGDEACGATYSAYSECLFPGGTNASGYTSTYCQDSAGKQSPAGKKSADALIACLTTTCGTDSACGTPEKVTWDNFALEFTENFCTGCHFAGHFDDVVGKGVGPDLKTDIPQFSDDSNWQYWEWPQSFAIGPQANPDWKTQNKRAEVAVVAQKIWCGVAVTLPDFCANDFPGHFPKAERFPPAGGDSSVTMKTSCVWNEGGICPQPTDFQRNQMVSWIFDGAL